MLLLQGLKGGELGGFAGELMKNSLYTALLIYPSPFHWHARWEKQEKRFFIWSNNSKTSNLAETTARRLNISKKDLLFFIIGINNKAHEKNRLSQYK